MDRQETAAPRFLLAAERSGAGKTTVFCALLSLLLEAGIGVRAFKCGPDYIDPMFHRSVLGIPSFNLDSFLSGRNTVRYLLAKHGEGASNARICALEGVMGYYDGLGGTSDRASAYEIARWTDTPVILLVDAAGRSLSSLASVLGFLKFRKDSRIAGVIFNRLSPMLYPALKKETEEKLGIRALGYVPVLKEFTLESRHLGLVRPEEIGDFKEQVKRLSDAVRSGIDLKGICELASGASPLSYRRPGIRKITDGPVIAVARDPAFCFYYQDNLELLEEMGAKLVFFSPMRDREVPAQADGLYLGGGYPELYGRELSENVPMLESVAAALRDGMPCIAECGGYLYLKQSIADPDGVFWPVAGVLPGESRDAGRLSRFGYALMTAEKDGMFGGLKKAVPVHEFHHWDSAENGDAFHVKKPVGSREWDCGFMTETMYAGFPHLYFYGNMEIPRLFLKKAAERKRQRKERT